MKKHDIFKKIGLGLAISALAACQASAIVAYSNQGVVANESSTGGNGPYALGNDFTVNQAISVTAIGAFLGGGSTMAASVPVAIYNVTLNAIVAGTTVTFASGNGGDFQANGSAFRNITSVTLIVGDVYSIVAANYGQGGAPYWWNHTVGTTPTFNDGGGLITLGGGRYTDPGVTSLTFPGHTVGFTPGIPTYGAGTFEYTALTPVPEVETFAIASVSMLGLVFIGRNLVPRRRF